MADRRVIEAYHPFTRLNKLLEGIAPGPSAAPDGSPINMSIGEPQFSPPDFITEEMAKAAATWSRYPPPRGTPAYLEACRDWLTRRFALPDSLIDPARHVLPLPGSREGLFFTALSLAPPAGPGEKPVILMPNPFYHVYAGAAVAADVEPVFVSATRENGFVPDFTTVAPEILRRTILCILCTPGNPQGAVATKDQLKELIQLARQYDFAAAFDECYSELYRDAPPPGALNAATELGGGLDKVLVFHSLSKRSSAPGLRCGFAAGDETLIDALDKSLRVGGAGVPLPVIAAATRLWKEEAHVTENRARYDANFEVAERMLGNRFGYRKPEGGFFLWLDVGDGEAAAERLWREGGLRVLPGGYMSAPDSMGENPGGRYIRLALVYDTDRTEAALQSLCRILGDSEGTGAGADTA